MEHLRPPKIILRGKGMGGLPYVQRTQEVSEGLRRGGTRGEDRENSRRWPTGLQVHIRLRPRSYQVEIAGSSYQRGIATSYNHDYTK